jgi:hypothetical protein
MRSPAYGKTAEDVCSLELQAFEERFPWLSWVRSTGNERGMYTISEESFFRSLRKVLVIFYHHSLDFLSHIAVIHEIRARHAINKEGAYATQRLSIK